MTSTRNTPDLGAVFEAHVTDEFVDKDVNATMTTVLAEPYGLNVPTATGGKGQAGVVASTRKNSSATRRPTRRRADPAVDAAQAAKLREKAQGLAKP